MQGLDIYIHAYDGICALGKGRDALSSALLGSSFPSNTAIVESHLSGQQVMYLGAVAPEYLAIDGLPQNTPEQFKNTNNALIHQVFLAIQSEWQKMSVDVPNHRVAVILGSSNAGIAAGEQAIAAVEHKGSLPSQYQYQQQEYGNPALFLSWLLGSRGPAYTISTACSSSAKAFISGARLLQQNLCDLAVVGGADVLSQLTANGFLSLEAVDGGRCQPFAAQRKGIHLGEAAALFVLSREPSNMRLSGWGEASDAYHMAAPQPDGLGAEQSMRHALSSADLSASQIDYLNLHGTATAQNDAMEAQAVSRIFADTHTQMSSTKPLTGHTLGAAGAIEAMLCCLTLSQSQTSDTPHKMALPIHWVEGEMDAALPKLSFVTRDARHVPNISHVMSNSFGFGGSNASLIFSRGV
jgi:3-oxoacyl-[acyl-carrier-protein] synthase-1